MQILNCCDWCLKDGKKGHEDSDDEEDDEEDEDAVEGVDGELDLLTKTRSGKSNQLHGDVTVSTPLDKVDSFVSWWISPTFEFKS